MRPNLALLLAASVLALVGCSSAPPAPSAPATAAGTGDVRELAIPIELDVTQPGRIHCDAGVCRQWFFLDLAKAGVLNLTVSAPSGADHPDFDVQLEDGRGETLWAFAPTGVSPREISRVVPVGGYHLLVESIGPNRDALEFEVLARLGGGGSATRPTTAAPNAAASSAVPGSALVPRRAAGGFFWLNAEMLGVPQGGDGARILLDAGERDDLTVGLRGELVQGGAVLATFELVDVDDAQSTAQLDRAIDPDVAFDAQVRVRVPLSP